MGLSVLRGARSFQHRLELCPSVALILGGQPSVRTFVTEQWIHTKSRVQPTRVDCGTLPKPVACQAPGAPRASLAPSWKWLQRLARLYFWQQQLGDYQDNAAAQVLISAWIHTTSDHLCVHFFPSSSPIICQ